MSLLDALDLPEFERVDLPKPPLALVICQIKFPPEFSVSNRETLSGFQNAVKARYPIAHRSQRVHVQIGVGPDSEVVPSSSEHQWRFRDKEGNWTVALAETFIGLETRRYTGFDEFASRFCELLEPLNDHFSPAGGERIGLRYVNEIRYGDEDLRSIIRSEVFGLQGAKPFVDRVVFGLQEVHTSFGAGQTIGIRHGMFRNGTTVQQRSGEPVPQEPFYLLDFDVAHAFETSELFDLAPATVAQFINEYHQVVYRLFRWAVADDYVRKLGVRA